MKTAFPKMTDEQAKLFWKSLTQQQKNNLNIMLKKLIEKKLMMTKITVDDNEQIQRIVLEDKDKPAKPIKPFLDKFNFE
jgi:hypothetical protein